MGVRVQAGAKAYGLGSCKEGAALAELGKATAWLASAPRPALGP